MDDAAGFARLLLTTALVAGMYLVTYGILAAILLLPFRKRVSAWLDRGRRRRKVIGWTIPVVVYLGTLVAQFMAPPFGEYDVWVASLWMRRAAEAPTREERERHVRRVMREGGGKNMYIAWTAIRHGVKDPAMRCELWDIMAKSPSLRGSSEVDRSLAECGRKP